MRVKLFGLLGFAAIVVSSSACGGAEDEPAGSGHALSAADSAEVVSPAMLPPFGPCPGQQNLPVTTSDTLYIGPHEQGGEDHPEGAGHASAVEVLQTVPTDATVPDMFTIAWVRQSDQLVMYRGYNTATKQFLSAPQVLEWSWPASSFGTWLRNIGHMSKCPTDTGQCAWFAWEDVWGWVDYRGIFNDGVSVTEVFTFPGLRPSGDVGNRAADVMLLAYITNDRTQVRVKLLDYHGSQYADALIKQITGGCQAFQTAVAWNGVRDNEWLVAWVEDNCPWSQTGQVWTATYSPNGGAGQPSNVVNCLGLHGPASCLTALSGESPLLNRCTCAGFWLSASPYSTSTDRYRLTWYTYGYRLDEYGHFVGDLSVRGGMPTYSIMVPANSMSLCGFGCFKYWTYQSLWQSSPVPIPLARWTANSYAQDRNTYKMWNNAMDFQVPQAARGSTNLAGFVATNYPDPVPHLHMTIADVAGNCPP